VSETFGQRLRRIREERGFAVPDLASSVGVSPGAIRQLESGQVKNPGFALGVRLSRGLCVDPGYLALGEGASFSERFDALDRRLQRVERALADKKRR
jgi:transcriptional regulator with XRE-family HTH domain